MRVLCWGRSFRYGTSYLDIIDIPYGRFKWVIYLLETIEEEGVGGGAEGREECMCDGAAARSHHPHTVPGFVCLQVGHNRDYKLGTTESAFAAGTRELALIPVSDCASNFQSLSLIDPSDIAADVYICV